MLKQPLDVVVERERARRLVDRFGRDDSDGGELARERRAHQVSEEFKRERNERAFNLLDDSRGKGMSSSVEKLETLLDGRFQTRMRGMLSEERQQASAGTTDAVPKPVLPAATACPPVSENRAGATASSSRKPPFDDLKDTLDDISVKSILDFRSAGSGVLAAEAVATAATCAIANMDDTVRLSIHSLNPEAPWPGALAVLGKPGHFINSLRKFPFVADSGKIPEDNMVGARHFLEMAGDQNSAAVHPAVAGLHRWVESAISYWEEASKKRRDAAEAVPSSIPVAATPVAPSLGKVAAPPYAAMAAAVPVAGGGTTAMPTSTSSSAPGLVSGRDTHAQPLPRTGSQPGTRPRSVPRASQQSPGSMGPAPVGTRRTAASPRPRPSAQGSATTLPPSWSAAQRQAPRHSGATSPQPRTASSPQPRQPKQSAAYAAGTAPITTAPASAARRMGASSQHRLSGSNLTQPAPSTASSRQVQSPARRAPTTQKPMAQTPGRPETVTNGAPRTTARTSPSRAPRSTNTSPRQAQSPPRASLPTPSALAPGSTMGDSKSTGALALRGFQTASASKPQGYPKAAPSAPSVLAPSASQSLASPAPVPPINGVQPQSVEEFRRMLEETKKEVREIRSIESQMKWNMQREERKEKILEEKEANDEIRDWRWKQTEEMKAYVEEKEHELRLMDLQESKSFQEFKRETKVVEKQEEQRYIHEQYIKDTENAAWRAELARAALESEKLLTYERHENLKEVQEIKTVQKIQEKVDEEETRALEQRLDLANQARLLQQEREQLLQNLEFARACQRNPPRTSAARRFS